jgi:hypothetical protein
VSERGPLSPACPARSQRRDPLEIFHGGLALFRRAGLRWFDAYPVAREAALSVLPEPEQVDKRLAPGRVARCSPAERERREQERARIEAARDEWEAILAYHYRLERADEECAAR